ncbi:hypothetical protein PG993_007743 [Apiospora rasikravindrae]|uniref:Uncharacterized protein n=1 Tax=Apiospora rasikravindrae TaxID=990691 RepID=A0ABR1SYC1_9PEZI
MKKSTQLPGPNDKVSSSRGATSTAFGGHAKMKGGWGLSSAAKGSSSTTSSSQIEQVISQQVKEAVHSRDTMPGRTQYNPHVTVPWERFAPPRQGQSVADWYHNLPDPWIAKRPNGNH